MRGRNKAATLEVAAQIMKVSRRLVLGLVLTVIFVLLIPIIPTTLNLCAGLHGCVPHWRSDPAIVSILYYGLGVGGRAIDGSYQVFFMPGWVCYPDGTCQRIMWSIP